MNRDASEAGRSAKWIVLALIGVALLVVPATSLAVDPPGTNVSVCQVTGSPNALNYAQVTVSVTALSAYLNQFPGSFVGTCPSTGGGGGGGGGTPTVPPPATPTLPPAGFVTICHISGTVTAPNDTQVTVDVDQLAAYLNANPNSFVGSCPTSGAPAGTPITAPNGFVTICHVGVSGTTNRDTQVTVGADDVGAYLNRNPNSFIGTCPSAGDPNGNPGPVPTGYATICRLTGNASSPYATVTIPESQLSAYLNQPGVIAVTPTGGCPTAVPPTGGTTPTGPGPGQIPPDQSQTVTVQTTPNTVVTATGAGTHSRTVSDKKGHAKVKVKPKRPGIVTIKGAGGKVIKRFGVEGAQTGKQLTG
jgi:hypothetical protein